MKKCPFCAEEIQDAAIVCKHCGRDLPTAPPQTAVLPTAPPQTAVAPRPAKRKHSLALVIGGLVLLWFLMVFFLSPEPTAPRFPRMPDATKQRSLEATAAKGLLSFSLTNRESTAIRNCRLYVEDAEGVQWAVKDFRDIAPLETAAFEWSSFTAQGQPMPGHIGRDRGVHASCLVTGVNQHLLAAFR